MDINDFYAPPAPEEAPAGPSAPETPFAQAPEAPPAPAPQAADGGKKEKSIRQQLTSFGITMVVLCFVMSLLAGAGGAYAMLNF